MPPDHPHALPCTTDTATPLRLWLQVFGVVLVTVVVLLVWTLLTPPFQGDLTRLGRLSETAFGPTQPTQPIDPALRVSSALHEADVLVIGDSFSRPLLWQSVLVARGLRVATADWQAVGPLCTDLAEVLRTQGFRGRAVVIESVERGLQSVLDAAQTCTHTRPGAFHALRTRQPARDWNAAGAFGLNTRETLFTGLLTAWHTHRARTSEAPELVHRTDGAARVRIQHLPDGCARFSHRLCTRGLFFADDRTAPPFTAATVSRLQQLAARHPGLALTWLVLPNKSSVYLEPERASTAAATLETTRLGPDLFAPFVRDSRQMRDLYSPNDTHLSPEGYRRAGQQAADWLTFTAARCRTAPDSPTHPPATRSACR